MGEYKRVGGRVMYWNSRPSRPWKAEDKRITVRSTIVVVISDICPRCRAAMQGAYGIGYQRNMRSEQWEAGARSSAKQRVGSRRQRTPTQEHASDL